MLTITKTEIESTLELTIKSKDALKKEMDEAEANGISLSQKDEEHLELLNKNIIKLSGMRMTEIVDGMLDSADQLANIVGQMKSKIKQFKMIGDAIGFVGAVVDIGQGLITSDGTKLAEAISKADDFLRP